MVKTCGSESLTGVHDKAILLALIDTGLGAAEFLAIDLEDVDIGIGAILVRQGKSRKPITGFIGKATRKLIRAYLHTREDSGTALWIMRMVNV